MQIVLRHAARDLVAIVAGRDGDELAVHEIGELGPWLGEDELAQRDPAGEAITVVLDVEVVGDLDRALVVRADRGERLGRRHRRA